MRRWIMRNKCKECGKSVPRVKQGELTTQRQIEAFACQSLHLCRYCYRMKFPVRPMWNLPAVRHGSEKVLTPSLRRYLESRQFEGMEVWLWEPEFYYEW